MQFGADGYSYGQRVISNSVSFNVNQSNLYNSTVEYLHKMHVNSVTLYRSIRPSKMIFNFLIFN